MKLASIEVIKAISQHPNADRLEVATVLGWQAIVKKGEFRPGDRCVFVVIDTVLPDAPWSEFLKSGDKPIRLRTVKLRGEYSQGLVLPISVLPENQQTWQEGADVGGELGIKKYEKEIPSQLNGVVKGTFPEYLASKTDEDNGLSNPDLVERVLSGPVVITQKLDGSSMTVIVKDGEITHVCSRRMDLKETSENAFWIAARKIKTMKGHSAVIQGELMGPGIQGNQLELNEPTMFVFQARGTGGEWIKTEFLGYIMESWNLSTVPLIGEGVFTIEELQEIADKQVLPNGNPAEGIVVRPTDIPSSGIGRPIGFKIINRNYGE